METNVKKQKSNYEIEIILSKEELEREIDAAYIATASKYPVQGFRKGKAPRKIIEQNYGTDTFKDEAIKRIFPNNYGKVLENHPEIKPIDYPTINKVEATKEGGFRIVASVDVEPEFSLGKYTDLEVKKVSRTVTDKDVEEYLTNLATSRARQIAADKTHKIQNGDIAVIDFEGSINGELFEGGQGKNHELEIGSGSFIEGFEEQLVGKKIGEKIDVKVTFPKQYHAENLAGKPAVFAVTINNILQKQIPAIDDKFASDVSEFNTLTEYKNSVKENLKTKKEEHAKSEEQNALLRLVVDNTKIEMPQKLVDAHLDSILQDFSYRLSAQGIDLETYAKYMGTTIDAIKEQHRPSAELSAKSKLVFDAIIEKEKIKISEADIDAEITRAVKLSGQSEKQLRASEQHMNYIKQNATVEKLFKFLTEKNKFV